MRLTDLLAYDNILVQCHDNPDADAIASGYGIYWYLKERKKNVRFIYSGKYPLQKSNLVLMVKLLHIPIEYVEESPDCSLLITVDCQYGESNVSASPAPKIAVIDHHQVVGAEPEFSDIRSCMCSCSTIVWDLLRQEGVEVNEYRNLATALYYGLYTDSNGFAELYHPLDKDLRDDTVYDKSLLRLFRNSNLSLNELSIAGEALVSYHYNETYHYTTSKAKPCDPNILGVISDMMLEVDTVDTCVVYSLLPGGVKLSVRSCIKEAKASDLAEYLCREVGSGGGHLDKAGGFIQTDLLGGRDPEAFINERMMRYFRDSEIIHAASYEADIASMKKYEKLPVKVGYVKASDVIECGTSICIRTLEGDLDVKAAEDLYILIGIDGEVYPNTEEKFLRSYQKLEEPYQFQGEYAPAIKDVQNSRTIPLTSHAKTCVSTGGTQIFAKQIDHVTKIFTAWDQDKYMLGRPGDYIAVRTDDYHDVYIIAQDIFGRTYKEVEE